MNKCIDIMDVNEFPDYDILYCDPPWEQRMVKWFETKMSKDVGYKPENTINGILTKLAQLASTDKPTYIEYGTKGINRVIQAMEAEGHTLVGVSKVKQSNYNDFVIISFNNAAHVPENLVGFDIVKWVMEHEISDVVFDPFAGIGATAKVVLESGKKYIGYELNPKRFEKLEAVTQNYAR